MRSYYYIRKGKIAGILTLTDEKALDLLEHGWHLRPCERGISA